VYHLAEYKEMTGTTRLPLPFTHELEIDAIETVVLLALSHHATLVSLERSSIEREQIR